MADNITDAAAAVVADTGANVAANAQRAALNQQMAAQRAMELEHAGHEQQHSIMFLILIGAMVLAQLVLYGWKRYHEKSYQAATLVGLLFFPFAISVYFVYLRQLFIWTVFCAITGWLLYKATRKPLDKATPRMVYTWFFNMYRASYVVGLTGYVLMMAEFLGITHLFVETHGLAAVGVLLLFYGLYYGVLTRDCAEFATSRMASVMGLVKKGELPGKAADPNTCGICAGSLARLEAPPPVPAKNSDFPDEDDHLQSLTGTEHAVTLSCGHRFHEWCIRGWLLIGKKDMCPYCSEKVGLDIRKSPWQAQGILWAHLLDALRYLVVFNPLILLGVNFVYWMFSLS